MVQGDYTQAGLCEGSDLHEFTAILSWSGIENVFDALPPELQQQCMDLVKASLPHLEKQKISFIEYMASKR